MGFWAALLFVAWACVGAALELTWPTGETPARAVHGALNTGWIHGSSCPLAKQPPVCSLQ